MKSIPVSQAFVFLSLFASACICLTCRAEEDQSKEMATKLAEICRKHDVPATAFAVVIVRSVSDWF